MKILFVCPYFYPKIGGLENYLFHVATILQNNYDYECIIVTSSSSRKYNIEIEFGLKIYRLPLLFTISNTPINILWPFYINKIIQKEKPDLINAHSPVPFIADCAFLVKGSIPFVFTYHAGSLKKNSFFVDIGIDIYQKYILRYIFKKSNKIVATSKDFINKEIQFLNRNVFYISPGVDFKLFKPAKKEKSVDVLYVGKIDTSAEWKGIDVLLKALKLVKTKHRNIKIHFIGDGNAIQTYKNLSKKLGLENNCSFLGKLTGKSLAEEYQKSKILVLPSKSEAESFGMVLLEAMACKTAVIGSKIGGIPSLVSHGRTGLLASPNNPTDLYRNIEKLLKNNLYAKKLSSSAYKKARQEYSWVNQVKKYDFILDKKL